MNPMEVERMLARHREWLAKRPRGARLNLSLADLQGYDFSGADLRAAKMSGANMSPMQSSTWPACRSRPMCCS